MCRNCFFVASKSVSFRSGNAFWPRERDGSSGRVWPVSSDTILGRPPPCFRVLETSRVVQCSFKGAPLSRLSSICQLSVLWQEIADKTLSSMPGFISTLGQSYHSPDGMGYKHVSWSRCEGYCLLQIRAPFPSRYLDLPLILLSFLFPLFRQLHWLDTAGPAYAESIPIIS